MEIMAKKKNYSLLEMLLIVFPITNGLGIDRFILGDTKWGIIRLVIFVLSFTTIGWILWIIDVVFLFQGRYQTDMLKYLK